MDGNTCDTPQAARLFLNFSCLCFIAAIKLFSAKEHSRIHLFLSIVLLSNNIHQIDLAVDVNKTFAI